jgi:hypothetical protein
MKDTTKLGKIFGIPVRYHNSWYLIGLLLAIGLAEGVYASAHPELSGWAHWALSLKTTLLWFGLVLLTEVFSIRNARRKGISVENLHLFFFGGFIESRQGEPYEFGIFNPFWSLFFAIVFAGGWWFVRDIAWLSAPYSLFAITSLFLAGMHVLRWLIFMLGQQEPAKS